MSDITKIEFPHTYEVLSQFINDIRTTYMNKLIQPDENGWNRMASGNLVNSVKTVINMDGQTIEASLALDEVWKFIEHGSKPEGEYKRHWPPPDAIKNWILIKPVLPRPFTLEQAYDQLKWSLAKAIGKKHKSGKMIPLSVAEKFIEKNNIQPRMYPTTDQLAYLIGRKIHHKGTKAYHYLQQSIDEMIMHYEGLIEEALSQDITDMVSLDLAKYFK